MSEALEQHINKLHNQPLTNEQMSEAVFRLKEFCDCLLLMQKEIDDESNNIGTSVKQGTGRRVFSFCTDFKTYRICDKKELGCC